MPPPPSPAPPTAPPSMTSTTTPTSSASSAKMRSTATVQPSSTAATTGAGAANAVAGAAGGSSFAAALRSVCAVLPISHRNWQKSIKVNPTKVRDLLGHAVLLLLCHFSKHFSFSQSHKFPLQIQYLRNPIELDLRRSLAAKNAEDAAAAATAVGEKAVKKSKKSHQQNPPQLQNQAASGGGVIPYGATQPVPPPAVPPIGTIAPMLSGAQATLMDVRKVILLSQSTD